MPSLALICRHPCYYLSYVVHVILFCEYNLFQLDLLAALDVDSVTVLLVVILLNYFADAGGGGGLHIVTIILGVMAVLIVSVFTVILTVKFIIPYIRKVSN